MDNRPIVSIIMPVYNTGDILKEAIESILNQTYSKFELILIDDGSNKATADICDQYQMKDNRIRVLHKKNAGTCCARNDGIELSRGEYITFCDHDDIYYPELLETEIQLMGDGQYDVVAVGALHIYDNGKKLTFGKNYNIKNKIDMKKSAISIIADGVLGTIWNVMYKKRVIRKISFNNSYRKGHEDIAFNLDVLDYIDSFRSIEKPLYKHYIRKTMSTSAGVHENGLEAMIDVNNKVCHIIEESGCDNIRGMELQGEYLRTCVAYSIRLGYTYEKFIELIRKLKFCNSNEKKFCITYISKNTFVYNLIAKRDYRILYIFLKAYCGLNPK